MKSFYIPFLTIAILLLLYTSSYSQNDLESVLINLSQDAGSAYVDPFVSSIGADFNSAWFHRAPKPKKMAFNIEIGGVLMGSIIGKQHRTFSKNGSFRFNRDQATIMTSDIGDPNAREYIISQIVNTDFYVGIYGPTVTGSSKDTVMINFQGATYEYNNTTYTVPSQLVNTGVTGFADNLEVLPLIAPQLTVGTVMGTDLTIRFFPATLISKDVGSLSYFGFGLTHNAGVWFKKAPPVDVSLGFYTQFLKIGDAFKVNATTFGIFGSKKLGKGLFNFTPYAGLSYEFSKIEMKYNFTLTNTPVQGETTLIPVNISLNGANTIRFMLGTSFRLLFFSVNADYTFASYNAFSIGAGVHF
jgi:hypothetical protein